MTMAILVCLLESGETVVNAVMHDCGGKRRDGKNF